MSKRNEIDGDLVVPGSLVVLGGFQNSSYSRTVTRLSGAEQSVTTIQGQIIDRPTYDEVASQGFVTLYIRSASQPTTPTGDSPAGWTLLVPSGSDSIWMSGAQYDFDGHVTGSWYTPVRFTGAATMVSVLTNDRHTVPCDADGNNGNYVGASTKMNVFEGAVDTTSFFTFGATASAGVTGSLSGNEYTVTLITVDSGYVDIVASRSGFSSTGKRFNLTRAKLGESAPLYRMNASSSVVKTYPDGTTQPETISFESVSSIGLSTPSPYAGYFKFFVNDILQFTSTSPQDTYEWNGLPWYPTAARYPTGIHYPALDWSALLSDVTVARMELWSEDLSVMLDSQNVSFLKDVRFQLDDILSQVPNYSPEYLGKYLHSIPAEYGIGDWFVVYGTSDSPYQRGVWVVNSLGVAQRIDGTASRDSPYISSALSDILWAVNNGNGIFSSYGAITYIQNLVASTAFIESLQTKTISLQSGGKIKSSNYVNGVSGFELDGNTGSLRAVDVVLSGEVNATSGSFTGEVIALSLETTMLKASGILAGDISAKYFPAISSSQKLYMQFCATGTIRVKFEFLCNAHPSMTETVEVYRYNYDSSTETLVYSESHANDNVWSSQKSLDVDVAEGDSIIFKGKYGASAITTNNLSFRNMYLCTFNYPGILSWIGVNSVLTYPPSPAR